MFTVFDLPSGKCYEVVCTCCYRGPFQLPDEIQVQLTETVRAVDLNRLLSNVYTDLVFVVIYGRDKCFLPCCFSYVYCVFSTCGGSQVTETHMLQQNT